MADLPDLRVSDEDRERATREIRDHYAAGRLTEDELDERVQAALRARTQGELAALSRDLPITPAWRKAQLEERRRELRAQIFQEAGGGVGLVVLCTVIWLVSGTHGFFWPAIVAAATLLPLIRSGWRLYGPAPDLERVEQELAQFRRRHDREQRLEARRARRGDRR